MRALSAHELVLAWEWGQDKHAVDRALLLLALAQPELTPDEVARLTVGQRNARLLTLRERTLGPTLTGFARCTQCAAPLEFAFTVKAIRQPEPLAHEGTVAAEGLDLRFRLPNSLDLAAVVGEDDATQARRLFVERCVLQATCAGQPIAVEALPDSVIPLLADAVAEHDPQAEIRFTIVCEECGYRWAALFDIVSFFWAEITALAKRLLEEVHTLAQAYGWREADILLMSAARRQAYLEMAN